MPWTPSDGPSRHTKRAQSGVQRRQWSDIANGILKRGGSEASAIRQANGVLKRESGRKAKRSSKRISRR